MNFESFVGNPETKAQLAAAVDSGRFPHALLLEGPEGSGKRTLAALLAKAAVCQAPEGEKPCGVCPGCVKAAAGAHPDIRLAGGDGAARSFHIDVVRELRESAYVLPNEAPRRVMILAGAQGMTEQAQNALLKVLEEPPSHALFLLTCENRSSLLPHRPVPVQCLTLGPVAEEEALPLLRSGCPIRRGEELRRSFRLFGGLIGRTLQGLEDGTFQRVLELAPRLAEAVAAPDELTLLRATAPLERQGRHGRCAERDTPDFPRRLNTAVPRGFTQYLVPFRQPGNGGQAGRGADPAAADGPAVRDGGAAGRPAAQHQSHPAADPAVRPAAGRGRQMSGFINNIKPRREAIHGCYHRRPIQKYGKGLLFRSRRAYAGKKGDRVVVEPPAAWNAARS